MVEPNSCLLGKWCLICLFLSYTLRTLYIIYIIFFMPVYIYCKNHGPFISYIYIDIYIHSQNDQNYLAPHPQGFCCPSKKKSRVFVAFSTGLVRFGVWFGAMDLAMDWEDTSLRWSWGFSGGPRFGSMMIEHRNERRLYGGFRKWWYPQIIHFNRVFHYKPSILGYPYFANTHMSTPNWVV